MPTSVPSFPDHDALAVHADRYGPRLLLWVWDRVEGEVDLPVSCAEFSSLQSIPMSAVWSIIDHLRAQSLIRSPLVRASDLDAPVVTLLAAGAEQARRLQAQRADPVERGRHLRRAVLHWIYAHADRRPLRISGFLDSSDIFFLGEVLSKGEVARAVTYLAEVDLVTCTGPAFHNGVGSHVALTPQGVDAVLSGSDIGAYVARQRESARPAQHTRIEATTVNYAQRDIRNDVRNDITVNAALSPSDVARLIQELAPALSLDPESRTALLGSADSLAGGGDSGGEPPPDRQRGLMDRIRRLLGAAPDTVGRQVLLDAVGQAMGRLLGS